MNSKISEEIQDEQNHGRQKYGSGPNDFAHDDCHSREEWVVFIGHKLDEAEKSTPRNYRHKMVQIAGLAVSAIEAFDRKQTMSEALKKTFNRKHV